MANRNMTIKGFLRKTTSKTTTDASAFLNTHRGFLEQYEAASKVLSTVDKGEITAEPALQEISSLLIQEMVNDALKKTKQVKAIQHRTSKIKEEGYTITCYTKDGIIAKYTKEKINRETGAIERSIEDMVFNAETMQEAEGLASRRMFDNYHAEYAVFYKATVKGNDGKIIQFRMDRSDATSIMLKKGRNPACRNMLKKSAPLKWHGKAKNDFSYFSQG